MLLLLATGHGQSIEKLESTKLLRYTIADCFARTEDRKWGVAIYANPKLKNKIKVSSVSGSTVYFFNYTAQD